MTLIENDSPKVQYTGPFIKGQLLPLTFPYIATEDVKMIIDDKPAIFNVDYEIITEPNDEHPVAYPNSAYIKSDLPNAKQITLYRVTPLDQQAPFPQISKFRSERVEQALDKLTMQQQEQEEQLSRCIIAPITLETFNGQLPAPAADQALKWNTDGTELENYDIIGAQEAFEQQIKDDFALFEDEIDNKFVDYKNTVDSSIQGFKNDVNQTIDENQAELLDIANSSASIASQAMSVAQSTIDTANTARQIAESAETKSDSAVTVADNANKNATNAVSTAEGAVTIATNASAKSDSAVATANTAQKQAEQAVTTANTAVETANNTQHRVDVFEEDINTVLDAADKIFELDESVQIAVQAAETANTAATTASKAATDAIDAVEEVLSSLDSKADKTEIKNGKLTIQANGSTVATFTANQEGDSTANIVIPDSAQWGKITGTLSSQTDLQNALNTKQDVISDLAIIRQGASKGATALQSYTETDPIYTADKPNIANINLSNLSEVGADKLNTSKMYTTGAVSEDECGYNQLIEMKHSTFDKSKFEVVGNPVITDDGVASGFSNSSHINIPVQNLSTNDFEISYKFTYTPSSAIQNIFRCATNTYGGTFGFLVAVNAQGKIYLSGAVTEAAFQTPLIAGNTYTSKIRINGTTAKLYLNEVEAVSYTWNKSIATAYISIGNNGMGGNAFAGSIYISQFSINVDGVEVFSGNKTGLDVLKPDDYTVVGNPVVSDDGIATYTNTTTSNNYIKLYENLPIGTNNIKIEYSGIFGEITDGKSSGNTCFSLFKQSGSTDKRKFAHFISCFNDMRNNTTIWYNSTQELTRHSTGIYITVKGDKYKVVYEFDDTTVYFKLYVNNVLKVTDYQLISDLGITALDIYMSSLNFVNRQHNSTFDLNTFKIHVDGDLVYQPCLKIPYTESKTGSKIVNANYRDRVQDVYEQYGTAMYYTLDEENKNFTLPMGEIYGMIEQKGTYHPPLLSKMWSDHLLNDMSWLRADTFSWQDGNTYSKAYNELLTEYNDSSSVEETEGEITFKRTPKGYKIALATQETAILNKYTADGIAWYYILDTTNKKFKLPRIKYKYWKNTSTLSVVGNGMTLGLSNGSDNAGLNHWAGNGLVATKSNYGLSMGTTISAATANMINNKTIGITTDPTKSGLVADVSSANEETGLYLYFYVGEFTKSAEAQTAGLKAELLNGKLDISNIKRYPIEVSDKSLMPSWYRVYSDGWCVQGGISSSFGIGSTTTIQLLKNYADTNYNITLGASTAQPANFDDSVWIPLSAKNTTSFNIYCSEVGHNDGWLNGSVHWRAEGYIN